MCYRICDLQLGTILSYVWKSCHGCVRNRIIIKFIMRRTARVIIDVLVGKLSSDSLFTYLIERNSKRNAFIINVSAWHQLLVGRDHCEDTPTYITWRSYAQPCAESFIRIQTREPQTLNTTKWTLVTKFY